MCAERRLFYLANEMANNLFGTAQRNGEFDKEEEEGGKMWCGLWQLLMHLTHYLLLTRSSMPQQTIGY